MYRLTDTISVFERADWNARQPRPMVSQDTRREAFIHHSDDNADAARRINSLDEQKAKMRAIQNFHMDGRGWSDIAYHFVVFQPYDPLEYARIFQGRRVFYVPAAQENHNTDTLAICVVGDFSPGGNEVKRSTRYAIEQLILQYRSTLQSVGGHRDVVSTSCPGDQLYDEIPMIADAVNLPTYRSLHR